jgi:hypothetical protein
VIRLAFGLAAVLALVSGVQTWRIGSLQESLRETGDRVAELNLLRRADASVITELVEANEQLAAAARVDNERAARVVAELRAERQALSATLERERRARAEVYRGDDYAREWAAAAVPGGITDRLLRANGGRAGDG